MASVDGSKSLFMTSDEAIDNPCDPCKFGGTEINGTHYCNTCAEYLCRSCKEPHQRFKATRNHQIISSKDVSEQGQNASQFKVFCTCDNALEVTNYCETHNEVACTTCKSLKHRKCNVTTLKDKSATYKISNIQNLIQNTQTLEDEIKQFLQDRDADVERIESTIETTREKIESFRREFETFFDRLEKNTLSELKKLEKSMRHDAGQHIPTCTTTLQTLGDDLKMLDEASKCSNTEMMFAADVKVSKRLSELQSMMKDFQDEVKTPFLDFEENKKLLDVKQNVTSLGTLRISELPKRKTETTNFLKVKVQNSQDVQIKLPSDKKTPIITGCTFMADGQLLVCDHYNNNIKLLNSKLDITDSLGLAGYPWDTSAVDSVTAVVTLPDRKQLQFIDIVPSLKAGKQIQLDKECYGVDVVRDDIYVICHDNPGNAEIRVFDKNGTFIRKIPDVNNNLSSLRCPCYIAVSTTSSKIYVSDCYTHTVRCISVDGSLVFNYKHGDLRGPRTVIPDEEGNILVCGQESCNIHVVTSTGQHHSLYTVEGRRYNGCRSLAYRQTDRTLVVGFWIDNNLLVLECAKNN